MNSMSRSAKKSLSRAGKQIHSGAVKAKQKAVEKIGKVPPTEEEPQIICALQQLKQSKTDINAISDISRNLFEASAISTTYMYQLSEQLKEVKLITQSAENNKFAEYSHQTSTNLCFLSQISYQFLQNMEKELVKRIFRRRFRIFTNSSKRRLSICCREWFDRNRF